jgi:hypothetical protein
MAIGCTRRQKIEDIRNLFKNPPDAYLPNVYWFWNGDIEYQKIKQQLQEMKRSGTVGSVSILGWEGLDMEYLSDEWFDKVKYACSVAKEEGLVIWLYDELRWPSGHAGGKVLESNPEYHAKCLGRQIKKIAGPQLLSISFEENPLAIIAGKLDQDKMLEETLIDISGFFENGLLSWKVPAGKWQINIFTVEQCDFKTTFTDLKYVDLLDSAAVDKFIRITYDEYYKRMPEYFGNVIQAVITDEPGSYCGLDLFMLNPGTVPWTTAFLNEFKKAKGYDLQKFLPALWDSIGTRSIQIKIDFYEIYANLLQQSYFKPLHDWCEKHHIKINIQPSHEETLLYATKMMGDYFKAMQYSHLPGADEVYAWDKNSITPKLASSAARAFGKQNSYCEVFAAYGWDITLEKMKAVTDWIFSRGINRLMLSSFYFSMVGDWRFEIPPSLFYQNPFWAYLPVYTDYTARLSLLLSDGDNIAPIAILYPSQTAQGLINTADNSKLDAVDQTLKQLSNSLLENQYDFDYLNERTLENRAVISKSNSKTVLRLKNDKYKNDYQILIMPRVSIISGNLLQKIDRFYQEGGKVIALGDLPKITPRGDEIIAEAEKIWGNPLQNLTVSSNISDGTAYFIKSDLKRLIETIGHLITPDIELADFHKSINYIHKSKNGIDIFFISNNDSTTIDTEISFSVQGIPQIWDPENGDISHAKIFRFEGGQTVMPLQLDHYGSLLVVFDHSQKEFPHVTKTNMKIERIVEDQESLIIQAYRTKETESYITVTVREITKKLLVIASLPERMLLKDRWRFQPQDKSFPEEIRRSGSWTDTQPLKQLDESGHAPAHPNFSGTSIYRQQFNFGKDVQPANKKYTLKTENVGDVMELWLNGKKVGVRCWHPYEFDVTNYLVKGKNNIEILITNTLANEYQKTQKPYFTGEKWGKILKSGLLELVKIEIHELEQITFSY